VLALAINLAARPCILTYDTPWKRIGALLFVIWLLVATGGVAYIPLYFWDRSLRKQYGINIDEYPPD
jgi:hypothetical protein